MAEPKHARRDRGADDAPPLEAGLVGPHDAPAEPYDDDAEPDEYLLLKVVEANGEHLRTMRWGLGLGTLAVLLYVAFGGLLAGALGPWGSGLVFFAVAAPLLGAGLHALARQLELLRRAVAATDHFVFGPEPPKS